METKSIKGRPWQVAALGMAALFAAIGSSASAETPDAFLDRLDGYSQEGTGYSQKGGQNSQDQLTSVFQLRDVPTRPGEPGFWAFDALKNLVEKYGCISGFPQTDGTFLFRGERNLTRYEFAAALNACLQKVELLIETAQGDGSVTREDLAVLFRLQEDFSNQLAGLGGRVDSAEVRIDELEDNQFSTTTKLNAEVIFQLDSAFGDLPFTDEDVAEQTTLAFRLRMNFDTSFSGRDRLRTRLQANNLEPLGGVVGTASATRNLLPTGFIEGNDVALTKLWYQFPIGDSVTIHVAADGLLIDEIFNAAPTAAFAYDALNLTVAYNQLIYDLSNGEGAALGANFLLGEKAQVDIGYWVPRGILEDPEAGIFNSNFSTGIHLNYDFSEAFSASIGYIYSYHETDSGFDLSGFVGTANAADPFGGLGNNTNNVGLQFNYRIAENFGFGGFAAYSFANSLVDDQSAELLHAQVNIYSPDLAKDGDVLFFAAAIALTTVGAI
ncbi:MAG: iron uptake porin, partial [Cyanobacteria bacterium J06641_5]